MEASEAETATLAAAAAFVVRLCLGVPAAADARFAVHLVARFHEVRQTSSEDSPDDWAGVDDAVFGAVAGAVWAAFPGLLGDPDDAAWAAAAACARTLGLAPARLTARVTLAAAALGLIARTGHIPRPNIEFVRAANWARSVEQHALAAWCARHALDDPDELDSPDRASALLVLAVATRDPDVIEDLYAFVTTLDPQEEVAAVAAALHPSLHPDGWLPHMAEAGAAVAAEDRRAAARLLRLDIDDLRTRIADDDMLRGLSDAYAALAAPQLDPDALRGGIMLVTGYLRDRQRFGDRASPPSSAVDLLLSLLTIRPTSTDAEILVEAMESLADAGLPELVAGQATFTAADDPLDAELLQADIARTASRSRRWSDAAKIMDGLHGVPALLLRRRRTTGAPGFVSVHLRPPDGLAIKNRAFPPSMVATVEAFNVDGRWCRHGRRRQRA